MRTDGEPTDDASATSASHDVGVIPHRVLNVVGHSSHTPATTVARTA